MFQEHFCKGTKFACLKERNAGFYMVKRKVIVKNKTLLELLEPADVGDLIDLQEISSVDLTFVDLLIDSEKEKAVAAELKRQKRDLKQKLTLRLIN